MKSLTLIFLAVLPLTAQALVVRSYAPATHDRINGFPDNPSPNPTFLFSHLDFSGVAWSTADTRKQFALISPLHFVGANHFRPANGTVIRFLNRAGAVREFTVASTEAVPNSTGQATDLFVGRLTSPVTPADQITIIPVHNLPTEAAYSGLPLVITGRTVRAGRGTIGAFQDFGGDPITGGAGINDTRTYTFTYNSLVGGNDDAHGENGDSGSPSFVEHNGALALVGTHTAVISALGTVTTYDTFVPHYLDEIDDILAPFGYNASRSNPTTTSLSPNATFSTNPLPAGTASALEIAVNNTGSGTARNLALTLSLPAGNSIGVTTAPGWVTSVSGTTLTARRGNLPPSSPAPITLDITPSSNPTSALTASGTLTWDTASSPVAFSRTADVFVPYSAYAASLASPAAGADNDHDGADNASEYAAGTDSNNPASVPAPSVSLTAGNATFTRRTAGHTTQAQTSTDLKTWTTTNGSTAPSTYGFERVTVPFPSALPKNFLRLRTVID